MTDPRLKRLQYNVAMTMKGTPIEYPKPTLTQRLKKWVRLEKGNIFTLCGCVALTIVVLSIVTSPMITFILCFFIGGIIGITLVDMFYY